MPTANQIQRMRQQRKNTYGLVPEETPPEYTLLATGVTAAMVAGNVTVFPLPSGKTLPADFAVVTQRMAPAGTLGDSNVDTLSAGVDGSFRIHSTSATETSTWRWFVYSAQPGF